MGARRNDRERERKCCLSRNTGSPQDKRVRERQSPEAERELFVFRTTREESTSEGLVWGQGAGVGVGGGNQEAQPSKKAGAAPLDR